MRNPLTNHIHSVMAFLNDLSITLTMKGGFPISELLSIFKHVRSTEIVKTIATYGDPFDDVSLLICLTLMPFLCSCSFHS